MTEKCYELFLSGIGAEATKKQYQYHLKRFLKETKLRSHTALLDLDDETRQDLVERYVLMLKKRNLRKPSIKNAICAIELFFDMNKKIIHKKILRKMISSQGDYIPGGEKAYTDEDVRKMLLETHDTRSKALIHFMASTASRPAAIDDPVLTFRNLRPMERGCAAIYIYEDSKEHYWGFLTPEAMKAVLDYRDERVRDSEKISKDSPIFRADYRFGDEPVKPLHHDNASQIIRRIVQKSKIERIKSGYRFDKALNTAFRKRFDTIVKSTNGINPHLAEKLMGHSVSIPLDNTYFDPELDRLFKEFVKIIPALTVDESLKLKSEIKAKNDLIKKQESEKDQLIKDFSERLSNTEKILKHFNLEGN